MTVSPKDMLSAEELLDRVTRFYFQSHDFNGLPARDLPCSGDELKSLVKQLLADGQVHVNFGDIHPNPHILALPPEPAGAQIEKVHTGVGPGGAAIDVPVLRPGRPGNV